MDGMTDKQFEEYRETLIKLILEKMENSKDLTEAKAKVKAMLDE